MKTNQRTDMIFRKAYSYHHEDGDFVPTHKHTCWELCYYAYGAGKSHIEESIFLYKPNDILLIQPGNHHNDHCTKSSFVFCFQFDYDLERSTMLISQTEKNKHLIEAIAANLNKMFDLTNKKVITEQNDQKINEISLHIIYLIFLLTNNQGNKKNNYSPLIDYIKQYLYRRNTINYHYLSEKTYYSVDRLRKIFKQETGFPIYKYHSELLLVKIKNLLANTNYSMKQISKLCGFSSQSMFSQFFMNKCDVSPLQYRNLYTNFPPDGVFKAKENNG